MSRLNAGRSGSWKDFGPPLPRAGDPRLQCLGLPAAPCGNIGHPTIRAEHRPPAAQRGGGVVKDGSGRKRSAAVVISGALTNSGEGSTSPAGAPGARGSTPRDDRGRLSSLYSQKA